jgi:hypothetical protein
MIVTLLIASLVVVLRIIRQAGWKRTKPAPAWSRKSLKILDSQPAGSVDSSQLAGLDQPSCLSFSDQIGQRFSVSLMAVAVECGKAAFTKQGKRRLEYALADGAGVMLGLTVGQG